MGCPYTLTSVKHMRSTIIKNMTIYTPFEMLDTFFEVLIEFQGRRNMYSEVHNRRADQNKRAKKFHPACFFTK